MKQQPPTPSPTQGYLADSFGMSTAESLTDRLIRGSENKARPIYIHQHSYGYVVTIGCASFCIETKEKVATYLQMYLSNPAETERKWSNDELLK